MSDHGKYDGVVDIARNGIDEVIRLKAENEALHREVAAFRWANQTLFAALEEYRKELAKAGAFQ